MTNKNKIVFLGIVIVVAILASVFTFSILAPQQAAVPTPTPYIAPDGGNVGSSGNVFNTPDYYTNGVGVGNVVDFAQRINIGPGTNQFAWKNKTGRTVYVSSANLGYIAGTATSSYLFYVGATTSAAFSTDSGRPNSGAKLLIDGATVATSTVASVSTFFTSTTTSAGVGSIPVPDGSYVVFQVQEKFGCLTNTATCERATSTNRGISNFVGFFRAWFQQ